MPSLDELRFTREANQNIAATNQAASDSEKRQAVVNQISQQVAAGDYGGAFANFAKIDPSALKAPLAEHFKATQVETPAYMGGIAGAQEAGKIGALKAAGNDPATLKRMELEAERLKEARKIAAAGPKLTPFEKTLETEDAKKQAALKENLNKMDNEEAALNDAFDAFKEYKSKTGGGTGPFATAGGLMRFVDSDLQALDSKFKKVSLDTMTRMFQGMSRAIDSDVERLAFEATQPSIKNDDPVNAKILLGAKALMEKNKAEARARQEYAAKFGNMTKYISPIIGKSTALVSPDGNIQIFSKADKAKALKAGYTDLDSYAKQLISPTKQSGPETKSINGVTYIKVDGGWQEK